MDEANRYLREHYLPAFNAEFMEPAAETGSGFVPLLAGQVIDDYLCEQHDRSVGRNNCVSFERLSLQIPQDQHRCNYVNAKVRVHRYSDGSLAIFHGPRKLADYHHNGRSKNTSKRRPPELPPDQEKADNSFATNRTILFVDNSTTSCGYPSIGAKCCMA